MVKSSIRSQQNFAGKIQNTVIIKQKSSAGLLKIGAVWIKYLEHDNLWQTSSFDIFFLQTKVFAVVTVNFFSKCSINTFEYRTRTALCDTWDKVFVSAFSQGFIYYFSDIFPIPSLVVNKTVFNATHERDLSTILLNQLRKIVGGETSLPDIDAHFNHIRN